MRRRLLIGAIGVVALLALCSASALGQCSMCRTALAGSNNALFIKNFNIGVLVLLVPPVTIFCSIFVVLKRYKTSGLSTEETTSTSLEDREP